mmetsp:Transcript_27279/g.84099  ORF Transcript_27279/g.84099 Transcript_27279/m.84099 type:complete len:157 (-) Transcript_27279:3783-4253(-)
MSDTYFATIREAWELLRASEVHHLQIIVNRNFEKLLSTGTLEHQQKFAAACLIEERLLAGLQDYSANASSHSCIYMALHAVYEGCKISTLCWDYLRPLAMLLLRLRALRPDCVSADCNSKFVRHYSNDFFSDHHRKVSGCVGVYLSSNNLQCVACV